MSCTRIAGAGSVDAVVVSFNGFTMGKRGYPVQHQRDDGDKTNGVLYRLDRPSVRWSTREVDTDAGRAVLTETNGAWALDDPSLDGDATDYGEPDGSVDVTVDWE
jgi:hypothetical protein